MANQPEVGPRSYPAGVPCWVDTEQPDVEAATRFYGELLGWTFEDAMPPGSGARYVIAKRGGLDAAGIGGPGEAGPTWNMYIRVDDADVAVQRLTSLGAAVRSGPSDAGEGGRGAVLVDPEGAEFRIWQPRRRPGAQAVNVPGAWNFSDLRARDPKTAVTFYQEAFGWETADLGYATMIRQPGYGDHLEATVDPDIRARQSGEFVPPGFADAIAWVAATGQDEPPHWHTAFTVADRDQTVDDAVRLGGQLLAQDDTQWTRTAEIRDPQGAVFTASQFTPPSG